jgi:hypothetical protein
MLMTRFCSKYNAQVLTNPKSLDAAGIVLSSLIIGLGMECFNFLDPPNYGRAFGQIILLSVSMLLGWLSVAQGSRQIGLFRLVVAVSIGLGIWLTLHTTWGVYKDWKYFSSHPEGAVFAHLVMLVFDIFLIPIFAVVYLGTIMTIRTLWSAFALGIDVPKQ